jgi:hypothetical protein
VFTDSVAVKNSISGSFRLGPGTQARLPDPLVYLLFVAFNVGTDVDGLGIRVRGQHFL